MACLSFWLCKTLAPPADHSSPGMPLRGGRHTVSFHGRLPPSPVWAAVPQGCSHLLQEAPQLLLQAVVALGPVCRRAAPGPGGEEGGKALGCGALTGEGTSEVKAGRPSV